MTKAINLVPNDSIPNGPSNTVVIRAGIIKALEAECRRHGTIWVPQSLLTRRLGYAKWGTHKNSASMAALLIDNWVRKRVRQVNVNGVMRSRLHYRLSFEGRVHLNFRHVRARIQEGIMAYFNDPNNAGRTNITRREVAESMNMDVNSRKFCFSFIYLLEDTVTQPARIHCSAINPRHYHL